MKIEDERIILCPDPDAYSTAAFTCNFKYSSLVTVCGRVRWVREVFQIYG